jgi:peptidoglycan/LPS O-acetylase OafA/YrhL
VGTSRIWPARLLAVAITGEALCVALIGYALVSFGSGMAAFDGDPRPGWSVAVRYAVVAAVVCVFLAGAFLLWTGPHRAPRRPGTLRHLPRAVLDVLALMHVGLVLVALQDVTDGPVGFGGVFLVVAVVGAFGCGAAACPPVRSRPAAG